jgi:arylsulfatase A-like enzyme
MKAMGLYEDATIIITGDHPAALSDSKMIGSAHSTDDGTRVTAMLFKRSGESGTPLKTSTAQISQDDLWNTIFESEGLTHEKTGESFYEIPEGVNRERRYIFELYKSEKNNGNKYNKVYEYKIVGNANDSASWEIAKETDIIK